MNRNPYHNIRVLIIDEDRDNLALLAEALLTGGMLVAAETSSMAALHRLDEIDFDLIITDIALTCMNGNQLLEEIRRRRVGKIPVIAATATPYMASRQFNRTLCKPYTLGDLWKTVRQVLPDHSQKH
jgi:two-component system chemotaxis response regulator CheY